MSDTVFVCEGISKRFGKLTVLRDLSLVLAPGAVTVLLGTNGAGKSTLLKLGIGVLRRDAGRMLVLGRDPQKDADAIRMEVGYVPSSPDVYPWMTPRGFYAFLQPHYPRFTVAHAHALAGTLQVPLDRKFSALSKGEGMKAMLVAALAQRPRVLLLDEPFSGLDPLVRDDVLSGVLASLREAQVTVFCATHELDVAARLADRVAILAQGKIEKHGTLAEVLGQEEPAKIPEGLREALREAQAPALA